MFRTLSYPASVSPHLHPATSVSRTAIGPGTGGGARGLGRLGGVGARGPRAGRSVGDDPGREDSLFPGQEPCPILAPGSPPPRSPGPQRNLCTARAVEAAESPPVAGAGRARGCQGPPRSAPGSLPLHPACQPAPTHPAQPPGGTRKQRVASPRASAEVDRSWRLPWAGRTWRAAGERSGEAPWPPAALPPPPPPPRSPRGFLPPARPAARVERGGEGGRGAQEVLENCAKESEADEKGGK